MHRRFVIVVFALFLAFTWSLSEDAPPATAEEEPLGGLYGGDFAVAVPQTAVFSLDPTGSLDETSRRITDMIYDPLARIHPDTLLPVPWVASSWTIDELNETVLVTLRGDVTWHDGTPVDADDVVFTYSGIYPASKISSTEVSFDLSSTDQDGRFFTEGLTLPLIMDGDSNPVEGCGAFTLVSQSGNDVKIEAYDDYFAGRPYIQNLSFTKFPGFDEAAEAMVTGEIGLIGWPLSTTEAAVFSQIENATIVNLLTNPSYSFLYVGVNTEKAPLDDPIIRKAIAMSTDKDLYLSLESNTIIADSVINPANAYWINTSVPRYRVKSKVEDGESKPDLDAVKVMLDEAGYTDQDSDGLREMPNGSDFSLDFLYPSSTFELQKSSIALNLIDKLQRIGVDVRQNITNSWSELYAAVDSDFDVFMAVLDTRSDPGFIRDILHSSGSDNLVRYNEPAFDQITEAADRAISMTERRDLVMDAQGWIAEENPLMPILHYKVKEVVNKTNYTGWVNMAGGVYNFWSFKNLHLSQGDPLRASVIILADEISSGEELDVRVEVNHPDTFAEMPEVFVTVTDSLTPDTSYTGYTDENGSFEFTWTAPALPEPDTAVFSARAITPGFPEGTAQGEVTVYPGARGLRVLMARNPARIASGETAEISITVRDLQTLEPIEGVDINLLISPAGLEGSLENPSGTTDAAGTFQTTFTASVTVDTSFLIVGEASMIGYSDGGEQTSVFVDRTGGVSPGLPGIDAVSIMLLVVVVTLGYAYVRRTRGS
jgi:peptide/nickel transport system substrate-binding protein